MNSQKYQSAIEQVFQDYAEFLGNDEHVQLEFVFDRERDRYLLIETGWQHDDRIYNVLIHVDIIEGKLWIQQDSTEEGVAEDLIATGVPKDRIVLGFKLLEQRQSTELAIF